MHNERILAIFDKIINALILGTIFVIPLYFNPFLVLGFQKTFIFRIFVELIMAVFVTRIIIGKKVVFPKKPYFYFSILLIFSAQAMATVFSAHPYMAVWGEYWRQSGLFTWAHFFIFAFIVHNRIIDGSLDKKDMLYPVFLSGLSVSVYAIIQATGFDFIPWNEAADGLHLRASSTMGQPNFLGTFLLFVIPTSFSLYLMEQRIRVKALIAFAAVLGVIALAVSYSRSAWIGFIFSCLFLLMFLLWKKNKKIFYAAIVGAVFLFVSLGTVIYANRNSQLLKASGDLTFVGRLTSLVDLKGESVAMRKLYYRAAYDIFMQSPFIGHGLDTQEHYYYRYYSPEYPALEKINSYPDRAHNEILDILTTTGLIGLAAWLIMFFLFLKRSSGFIKTGDAESKRFVFCLVLALAGSSVSAFFGFFTDVSYVLFFTYLAVIFAVFESGEKIEKTFELRGPVSALFILTIASSALFYAWQYDFRPQAADYYYNKASGSLSKNDLNAAIDYFNKSIDAAPGEIYYRNRFAIECLPFTLNIADAIERRGMLAYLLDAVLEADESSYTMETRAYLAILLSEIGKIDLEGGKAVEDIPELNMSHKLFSGLSEDVPGMARIHYDHGKLYSYEKKYAEAIGEYEKALSLYPDLRRKDINTEHLGYIYEEMIFVYKADIQANLALGKQDRVVEFAEKGLRLNPFDLELWDKLSQAEMALGRDGKVKDNFEHLAVVYPENYQVFKSLGDIYGKMKITDKAEQSYAISEGLKEKNPSGTVYQISSADGRDAVEKFFFVNHVLLSGGSLSMMLNVFVFVVFLCFVIFVHMKGSDGAQRRRYIFGFFTAIWMVLFFRWLAVEFRWAQHDYAFYLGKSDEAKGRAVSSEIYGNRDYYKFVDWCKKNIAAGSKVYLASDDSTLAVYARFQLYPGVTFVSDYKKADLILMHGISTDKLPAAAKMLKAYSGESGLYEIKL